MPKVKVSSDITTLKAGVATIAAPEGTDIQQLLNNHLNKHANGFDLSNLPNGVTISNVDVTEARNSNSSVHVDWKEPTN